MGQTFGGLTNTAMVDPATGGAQWFPNNPAGNAGALSAWAAGQRNFQPPLTSLDDQGNKVPLGPNDSTAAPSLVRPSPQQAASIGAPAGGVNAFSPGLTKAGKLFTLLSSGLQGALAGRAASEQTIAETGGRRAGGFGTGFGAGVTLPWQRAMLPLQFQEQAAKTSLAQAGAQPVNTPYGPMPAEFASRSLLPWMVRAGAQTEAAQIGANARVQSANIGAQNRLDVVGLQTAIAANKGAKFLPDVDQQTGQQFYHVLNPYGQEIGRTDVSVIPSLMARQSTSVDYKQLDDGSIVALPKTTTSRPMIDLTGLGKPSAQPSSGGPRTVTGAGGAPLQGSGASAKNMKWVTWTEDSGRTVAGPLSMARQMGAQNPAELPTQEVRDVNNARQTVNLMMKTGDPTKPETMGTLQLIDSLDKDGKLGILASRWNSLMTRGVGAEPGDDPRIVTLLDKGDLQQTAAMLAHFGASGGRSPQMLQHFMDLANAAKMDGPTLKAGTLAIADYMRDKAMLPTQATSGAPPAGAKVRDYTQLGR